MPSWDYVIDNDIHVTAVNYSPSGPIFRDTHALEMQMIMHASNILFKDFPMMDTYVW